MVKSKQSATASARLQGIERTMAGHYPSSMGEIIGDDGRISLDPADYDGYTQQQVEMFLASQPYEVNAVFASDGRLVAIRSYFRPDQSPPIFGIDGETSFHNHPNAEYEVKSGPIAARQTNVQVFSADDIGYYTQVAGNPGAPSKFVLRSWDGRRLELDYVGGGSKDTSDFAHDYRNAFESRINRAENRAFRSRGSSIGQHLSMDMDTWLRRNSRKYGFDYSVTWTMTAPS